MHRGNRRRDDEGDLDGEEARRRARGAGQLDLHDGSFRRARFARADAPARRHARPDGQARRLDHRDADHLELQGRPVGDRVLQLHPRRPQGPRRHRAEDRELGLPDAPSGRRRAGLHHHDRGLRDQVRHQGARDHRRGHGRRLAREPHSRPHHGGGHQGSGLRQGDRQEEHAARGAAGRGGDDGRRAGGPHPFGADLRDDQRRVRQVLRPRSRARHSGQHGRSGGCHRRAVDRRAGHAAHHAHLPYRRRRADFGAVLHRVEFRRQGEDQDAGQVQGYGEELRRRYHRHGPQHRAGGARP